MQTLNVRQFRSIMPQLKNTLRSEREIILISNGLPVARVLPIDNTFLDNTLQLSWQNRLQELALFHGQFGEKLADSAPSLRAERDLR